MLRYGITMGIRVVCVVLLFFVHGWWLILPVVGAIVLPYIAVVFANTVSRTRTAAVVRPGALVPVPIPRAPESDR